MVVIDRLSKYAHFTPLRSNYTNKQVVDCFVNMDVKLNGFLKPLFFIETRFLLVIFGNTYSN